MKKIILFILDIIIAVLEATFYALEKILSIFDPIFALLGPIWSIIELVAITYAIYECCIVLPKIKKENAELKKQLSQCQKTSPGSTADFERWKAAQGEQGPDV